MISGLGPWAPPNGMVSDFSGAAALAFLELSLCVLCFSMLSKLPGGRQPYSQQPRQPSPPRPPPHSTGGARTRVNKRGRHPNPTPPHRGRPPHPQGRGSRRSWGLGLEDASGLHLNAPNARFCLFTSAWFNKHFDDRNQCRGGDGQWCRPAVAPAVVAPVAKILQRRMPSGLHWPRRFEQGSQGEKRNRFRPRTGLLTHKPSKYLLQHSSTTISFCFDNWLMGSGELQAAPRCLYRSMMCTHRGSD